MLSSIALASACSSAPTSDSRGETDAPVASIEADLQASLDVFSHAIGEQDALSFETILSSEVLAQIVARGYDVPSFLEKQRSAIWRTLDLEQDQPVELQVANSQAAGDAVRVGLRANGKELTKPLYFVLEGGSYRINFGAPGFSNTPPDGALFGKDNYQVHNVNIFGNAATTLECYQGGGKYKSFTVAATKTVSVACENQCGWFSGSTFAGNDFVRRCDWNWWGADVVINLLAQGGWFCNDPC
jgi:hypothetical protein